MFFPDELSGLPSVRESECGIEVVSGRGTISFLLPYRMAPAEREREHDQSMIGKLGRERLHST